jgi:hypothetical protein
MRSVTAVTGAWGAAYPAKVRVPNAQLRVVSAPQQGLLTALLVELKTHFEGGGIHYWMTPLIQGGHLG